MSGDCSVLWEDCLRLLKLVTDGNGLVLLETSITLARLSWTASGDDLLSCTLFKHLVVPR